MTDNNPWILVSESTLPGRAYRTTAKLQVPGGYFYRELVTVQNVTTVALAFVLDPPEKEPHEH